MRHDGRVAKRGFVLCIAVLVAGCEPATAAKAGSSRTGKRKDAPSPVAVVPASRGDIASSYVTTATLEPEKTAPVIGRVAGLVDRLHVEEGDVVKAGAPLLHIESAPYRLRVAQLAARTAQLRDSFKRLKKMVAQQLVGAEEFERVKHDLEGAEAEEKIARLDLSYTTVRAPFGGRVTARMVEVGHSVDTTAPLFTLADLQPLLARVYVPSKAFKRLAQRQPVELELDSSGVRLTGHIKLVSPVIDPTSGTIKVTLEIPEYPAGTRPGDFAHVRITTETHEDALLVPRNAVVQDRQQRIVYVVVDGRAQRRVVEVGFEQGNQAEILKGLVVGDSVVTKGQNSLKDGAAVKVLEADA